MILKTWVALGYLKTIATLLDNEFCLQSLAVWNTDMRNVYLLQQVV